MYPRDYLTLSKIGNAPNDLRLTLNTWCQKYPIYIKYLPRGANFGSFCSSTSRFWDTSFSKIGNAVHRMASKWPWTHNGQKYPTCTKYLPPRPKVWSVSLYNQPFSRYKIVENRKCTEGPENYLEHLAVKSTLQTPDIQILVRLSYDQPFWRYSIFCNSPLNTNLNVQQIPHHHHHPKSEFQNSLNNFVRDPPYTIHDFSEVNLWCVFRGESFEMFTRM